MRRFFALTLAGLLALSGCSAAAIPAAGEPEASKELRLLVLDSEGTQLDEISGEEAEELFLGILTWPEAEPLPEEAEAEFLLSVVQEDTLLFGEDPEAERGFTEIARVTVYRGSSVLRWELSDGAAVSLPILDGFTLGWREAPAEALALLPQRQDPESGAAREEPGKDAGMDDAAPAPGDGPEGGAPHEGTEPVEPGAGAAAGEGASSPGEAGGLRRLPDGMGPLPDDGADPAGGPRPGPGSEAPRPGAAGGPLGELGAQLSAHVSPGPAGAVAHGAAAPGGELPAAPAAPDPEAPGVPLGLRDRGHLFS